MYILDTGNHCVRKIMSATGVMTLFYGTNGTSGSTTSLLNSPTGIAVTPTGIVFVSDTKNNRIVRVNSQGVGSVYASSVTAPGALALDLNGNLYISTGGLIRRISSIGQVTIGGGGAGTPGTAAATATSVALGTVLGLTVDSAGTVYAVLASNRIVTINQQGQVQTLVGTGTAGWSADGPVTSATAITTNGCGGIATDKRGAIYFAEANYIRKYMAGVLTTVAGTGGEEFVDAIIPNAGLGGDSGLALMAQIKSPSCFAFDANTRLLLTEPSANKIRLVTCAGVATTIPIQYGLQGVRYIQLQGAGVQLQVAQIVVLNTLGQNVAIHTNAFAAYSGTALAPTIVDGFYWNKPEGAIYQSVGSSGNEFIRIDLGQVPREITAIIVYLREDVENYRLTDYNSYTMTVSDTNGNTLLNPSPSFINFTYTSIAPYVCFDLRVPSANSKTATDILGGFRTASPEVFCVYESSKPSPLNYTQATARTLAASLGFSLATYTQLEEALCYGASWTTAGWTTGSSTIAYNPGATGIQSYTPSNGLAAVLCYGLRPLSAPAGITILPFSPTSVSSGAPVITPYMRYIRVTSTMAPLRIAQVIVTSAITGGNLAYQKLVRTSVPGNTTGPNAVDGLAYAKPSANSYQESQAGAWWEVDLGAEMLIETVTVWSPQGSSQPYQIHGYTEKRTLYPIAQP